jgi:hypothetical protein
MADPITTALSAINSAAKVASTPLFTTVIDRVTGFKISQWAAEGEIRKKRILDDYEKAKNSGIIGIQYISALREITNLINTAVKSAKYVNPDKPNDIKMDNDFFWNTIEHSKSISNEEMQELIAKIIAGEYNTPGTYSMSTLQIIKMLGKNELELFERICSLLIDDELIPMALFNVPISVIDFLQELHIHFNDFQMLQSLGLFLPNSATEVTQNLKKGIFSLKYFDKTILFKPENENYSEIRLPTFYSLSMPGKQILRHLKPPYNEKYFVWLKANYKIPNYKILE